MSLALFTASINNGRPWNYKDFSKSKFQTGDERELIILKHKFKKQD